MHTPSIAFRHLPPNSARFSYATEGALFKRGTLLKKEKEKKEKKKKKKSSVSIQMILLFFELA